MDGKFGIIVYFDDTDAFLNELSPQINGDVSSKEFNKYEANIFNLSDGPSNKFKYYYTSDNTSLVDILFLVGKKQDTVSIEYEAVSGTAIVEENAGDGKRTKLEILAQKTKKKTVKWTKKKQKS